MIGSRTRYSLAQFLELQQKDFCVALVNKHGMRISEINPQQVSDLTNCLLSANDKNLLSLVKEVAQTGGDLRSRVSPKYCYDERFSDMCRCLQLDGYFIEGRNITQTDPSISDSPSLDDDLLIELNASGLPDAEEIILKINSASELFRTSPPNYNACLNDIRVALETLAKAIAVAMQSNSSPHYDNTKWGSVIGFLKIVGFITPEEEKGLAGVYGFVSPGSHRPVGISEEQMARLGRSLALSMCWFLIKSHKAAQ
ncbi:hypothetical protein [Herminiimonas contaminans]|jgi:hypothetical protein|uniref:Abortive infection Abi-like protein n=1 Tax=Herminiimonas contaminans TaxID=1111140 RepID=A0ABS0EMR3_9BURK|nr:hypothetical protein [Herminiimonas contaminans]MBF8176059.1 hypothetical protein [Herminiimonas contaminans]